MQRIGIEQVTLDARGSGRDFLARPHKRATLGSGINETAQQARAHKTRSTCH
jgi:hypothetical protein